MDRDFGIDEEDLLAEALLAPGGPALPSSTPSGRAEHGEREIQQLRNALDRTARSGHEESPTHFDRFEECPHPVCAGARDLIGPRAEAPPEPAPRPEVMPVPQPEVRPVPQAEPPAITIPPASEPIDEPAPSEAPIPEPPPVEPPIPEPAPRAETPVEEPLPRAETPVEEPLPRAETPVEEPAPSRGAAAAELSALREPVQDEPTTEGETSEPDASGAWSAKPEPGFADSAADRIDRLAARVFGSRKRRKERPSK